MIDSPVRDLYEAISKNDYRNPNVFAVHGIPDRYKARMLLCMATALRMSSDCTAAMKLLNEAKKLASKWRDEISLLQAEKELAIIQSISGNHKRAVNILEASFPLARSLCSTRHALYVCHLNALAVELPEVGRLEEARRLSRITLASPLASVYSEFHDTAEDLKGRGCLSFKSSSRSGTSRKTNIDNIVQMPRGIGIRVGEDVHTGAKVLDLVDWKMQTRRKDEQKEEPDDDLALDEREKIYQITGDPHMRRWQLKQVRELLEKLQKENSEQGETST